MAIRLLLVGLVIGLGVDLPGGAEIASWARAEVDWIQTRVDGWLASEDAPEPEAAPDAEFAAIVDDMAASFTADLARAEPPAPEPAAARPALASAPLDLPEADEPGLAFALGSEPGRVKVAAQAVEAEPSARRLGSAIRLTRDAAAAWLSLARGAEAAVSVR